MSDHLPAPEKPNPSSRSRLLQAALSLFASQGITATTTRQIAEQAGVNEVTLFRQFGNKEGLILAVLEECPILATPVLANLHPSLRHQPGEVMDWAGGIESYASTTLDLMEQVPHLLRSLVGEADQYSPASRQALGLRLTEANQALADYLQQLRPAEAGGLPATALASLLNELLLGYVLVQATSEFNQLWPSRQAFIASLTTLFAGGWAGGWVGRQTGGAIIPVQAGASLEAVDLQVQALGQDLLAQNLPIQDIPAPFVEQILRQASKSHLQDYALVYSLFGAGLTAIEALGLQRHQQISSAQQHLLIVTTGGPQRQVPLNQWIAGRRYGSYTNNPLIKWLRSRKDQSPAMFINDAGQPLQLEELQQRWQLWTAGLTNPSQGNQPLQVYQTRQTWCVEMLMRGISLENLSLLTGLTPAQLQPYVQRAREKAALEQATQLDRKVSGG